MEKENNNLGKESIYEKIKESLDLIIASVGVLLGIFIIYLSLAFEIHQQDIGGTIVITSALYLLLRKRLLKASENFQFEPTRKFIYINNIIFFLSLSLSVWFLYNTLYSRPLIYFILVAVACASIALEILYSNNKKWAGLILIKILLIGITFYGGIYYEFPGDIYGVDTKFHNEITEQTIEYGHIVHGQPYSYFPIFHIFAASTSILTSLNVYNSIFLSMTFLYVFSVIFVFLIGQKLINKQAGFLAALMLVVGDYRNFFGSAPIPMSLGAVFFTMILYLLIVNTPNPSYKRIIAFFLLSILILTHTIAGFVMFAALISLFIWKNITNYLNNISVSKFTLLWSTAITFGVMLIAYWMHAFQSGGLSFFDQQLYVLNIALTQDVEFAVGAAEKVSYYVPTGIFEIFLIHLGYLIFLGMGIIGIYILLKDKNEFKVPLCLTMVVLFAITYGVSLFGIGVLLQSRWFTFIYVILAIVSAFGIFKLANLINKKFREIAVVTIIFLLSLIMITSPAGITILHPEEKRSAMASKTSELQGYATINRIFNGTYGSLGPGMISPDYNYSEDKGKLYVLMKDAFKYALVRTEVEIKGGAEVKRNTLFILRDELKIGLESNSNVAYDNGEFRGYVIKNNL